SATPTAGGGAGGAAGAPATAAPAAPAQPTPPPMAPSTSSPSDFGTSSPAPAAASAGSTGSAVHPARDQQDLLAQGSHRPEAGEMAGSPQEIFSDDWWGKARPIIDMHGYFRTRAELFHNFFLGRHSSNVVGAVGNDGSYLFPAPLDQSYQDVSGNYVGHYAAACGPGDSMPKNASSVVGAPDEGCYDKTQTSANVRLRLDPEIVISDNLRISTEIFALDNLVLGSTPNSYATAPSTGSTSPTGYTGLTGTNRFAPISFLSTTQGPPTAGVNGNTNSISVQRVWAEYMTPLGQLRFGRMPGHWGLGMIENSGDGIDSDYQTTLDRIQFISGLKSMDLYFGGSWDFPSSGPTSSTPYDAYGGEVYNTCNLCNVSQWSAFVARRTSPELQKLQLSRGDFVLNGGVYTTFRTQELDIGNPNGPSTNDGANSSSLTSRKAWAVTPDLWVQALWRKFRFEAELATINGQIGGYTTLNGGNVNSPVNIREYGITTQTEFRAIEDKLDLQFGFGWASGDQYANNNGTTNNGTTAITPAPTGVQGELNNPNNQVADISTFRFNPDYRVDLIFYRHIMQQIAGSYYFRPSLDYDFLRHPDGEKLGAGAALVWSRASEFVQTPGHKRDLGVEVDATLYYQSKDGSLNDDPSKIGGFFAMLQYGVFFPLGGLSYLSGNVSASVTDASVSAAQTVRLFLGVAY
ncbi:MAG: TIGR04551 family protein, partial [Polyangiaceae bacterium]